MKKFSGFFRRLRGKMTLSYMLTSIISCLLIECVILVILIIAVSGNFANIILYDLQRYAPQATPYFVHTPPNREELSAWLDIVDQEAPQQWPLNNNHPHLLCVVDVQGSVLASKGTQILPEDDLIQNSLPTQSRTQLLALLHVRRNVPANSGRIVFESDHTAVAMVPIVDKRTNSLRAALVMQIDQPDPMIVITSFSTIVAISMLVVTTIAALAGLIFGYLTSRGLTRRLKRLSDVADKWSQGDFSIMVYDPSGDELGQTAQQLNRMADQLQNLFKARQKLATLEERNRLARDLHDSVKQQVFAVNMQIAATKLLLRRDPDAAETRLLEAQKLVRDAQQELTTLIRELRPVALEGKGLLTATRELVMQWSQQTDIVANVSIENEQDCPADSLPALSLTVEEAFYRIIQEALSNCARHSKASLVQILFSNTDEMITLTIIDNGQGFDQESHEIRPGVGLLSMQERLRALGGNVEIKSVVGRGTTIRVQCRCLATNVTGVA